MRYAERLEVVANKVHHRRYGDVGPRSLKILVNGPAQLGGEGVFVRRLSRSGFVPFGGRRGFRGEHPVVAPRRLSLLFAVHQPREFAERIAGRFAGRLDATQSPFEIVDVDRGASDCRLTHGLPRLFCLASKMRPRLT